MRTGLIARKVGMTRIFDAQHRAVPVTVLCLEGCQVTDVRTEEKDGYTALQLGSGRAKVKNVSKPMRGHFAKARVEPKERLAEFRVPADALLEVGTTLTADHFVRGQRVDVTGMTIGKGFAGPMKRHNFAGLEATHGVSAVHRHHGATGGCQDPGKVWSGQPMAGRMGDRKVTVQDLEVVDTDTERDLILVRGSVPGNKNNWVFIKDSVKQSVPEDAPFPAAVAGAGGAAAEATEAAEEKE
mgnify:CR=1 FL=1